MGNNEIKFFSSASYLRNTKTGENGKECACCGRQTREELFVEIENLGWFPLGPECAKKVAKAGNAVKLASEV
jgi:uncharacterized ferredoxin-like protein